MRSAILLCSYILIIFTDWPLLRGLVPALPGIRHLLLLAGLVFAFAVSKNPRFRLSALQGVVLALLLAVALAQYAPAVYQGSKYLLGALFTYLFYLAYLIATQIRLGERGFQKLLAAVSVLNASFAVGPLLVSLLTRESLRGTPGLFRESGALAFASVVGYAIAMHLYLEKKNRVQLVAGVICFATVVFSTLKKSYIELVLVSVLLLVQNKKIQITKLRFAAALIAVLLVAAPAVVDALRGNILENQEYLANVGPDGHVRIGMYMRAYAIAIDYFPFGTGFGSFASLASIIGEYSVVHHVYGVDLLGSNSPSDVLAGAHTLLDTFWPHALGEMGFLGAVLLLLAYLLPLRELPRKYTPLFTGITASLMFDGLFLYTPEIPFAIFLTYVLAGLAVALGRGRSHASVDSVARYGVGSDTDSSF